MISILSESAPIITVSVGNEVRVLDGHKPETRNVQGPFPKKTPGFNTESITNRNVDKPFNKEQLQASVARLQEALRQVESRVELSVDNDINQVIFRVVDKESGDLIRQIPSEKMVELERFFSGDTGLFVEENV